MAMQLLSNLLMFSWNPWMLHRQLSFVLLMEHQRLCGSIGNLHKLFGHRLLKLIQGKLPITIFQVGKFQAPGFGLNMGVIQMGKTAHLEKVAVQTYHAPHKDAHHRLILNLRLHSEQVMEMIGMMPVRLMDGPYHIIWHSLAMEDKIISIVKV